MLGNSGTAHSVDYAIKRWPALVRYIEDGRHPIDNNPVENPIRPIALGRKNWLFAGSETAGKRACAIMSLLAGDSRGQRPRPERLAERRARPPADHARSRHRHAAAAPPEAGRLTLRPTPRKR